MTLNWRMKSMYTIEVLMFADCSLTVVLLPVLWMHLWKLQLLQQSEMRLLLDVEIPSALALYHLDVNLKQLVEVFLAALRLLPLVLILLVYDGQVQMPASIIRNIFRVIKCTISADFSSTSFFSVTFSAVSSITFFCLCYQGLWTSIVRSFQPILQICYFDCHHLFFNKAKTGSCWLTGDFQLLIRIYWHNTSGFVSFLENVFSCEQTSQSFGVALSKCSVWWTAFHLHEGLGIA